MKTRRRFLEGMLFAGVETGLSATVLIAQPQEFPRQTTTDRATTSRLSHAREAHAGRE